MLHRLRYSLSLRLLAIFLLLAALFAWGVVSGIRWAYSADDMRSLISGHLSLHIDYVRQDIGVPPRLDRALAITRRVPVDVFIEGPGVRWASDPAFPDPATLQFGPSNYFSAAPGALLDELRGVVFATHDEHRYFRFNEGGYDITVVTPKIADHRSRPPLVPILVGFALLVILWGYLAVRDLFQPILAIRDGAAIIGAGHFGHRIRVKRDDELGALASDINLMAARVEGMLDAKRELLLGVSHELRTPLSRLMLGLELLDDAPALRNLRRDVEEMRSIVETLLEAERLGTPHAALQPTDVDLEALVSELVEGYFPGESRLQVRLAPGLRWRVDGPRLQLLLKNLVANALRYSGADDGPVELSAAVVDGRLELRVRDHGPGLPDDQRAHLGEPFYRSDASRARATGGTGLGIYLARQVARAHGGDLELVETGGRGALFVVRLPAPP